MKRNIKKQFYVSEKENEILKKKAKTACLSEASLIRLLIKGYAPKEKPGEEFYKMMNQITNFAEDLESMACRKEEKRELYNLLFMEAGKWNAFRSNVEEFYLRPEKGK